tara:strand:+ start:1225 stop:1446 length:222 start_codon:yes stop_codon:yes gene_type:complete
MSSRIKRNAARCRSCGDIVEVSAEVPTDECSCGSVKVGGGLTYVRHYGDRKNLESLVEYQMIEVDQTPKEPQP